MSKKLTLGLVDDLEMPVTVGNPAAAASLAIDQSHMEEFANAEERSSDVSGAGSRRGAITSRCCPETGQALEGSRLLLRCWSRGPRPLHRRSRHCEAEKRTRTSSGPS